MIHVDCVILDDGCQCKLALKSSPTLRVSREPSRWNHAYTIEFYARCPF